MSQRPVSYAGKRIAPSRRSSPPRLSLIHI